MVILDQVAAVLVLQVVTLVLIQVPQETVVVMVESRVESRSAETARGSAPSVTSTATSSSSYVEVTFTSSRSDAVGRCDDLVPEPERPRCGVPRGPARAVDVAFF